MNSAVAMPQYALEDGDAERDRELVLRVWHGNLGSDERMAAKYDWFYLSCPYGKPILQLLRSEPDDACVGVCTVGYRRMIVNGAVIDSGVVVDLAVVEGHRSLGPALALQQHLVERARRRASLLLGFPNARAVPMFRRAGHQKLADLVRYVRVLRHGPYFHRRMRPWLATPLGLVVDGGYRLRDRVRAVLGTRIHARWSRTADPGMDVLWSASRPATMLTAVRDSRFVRWRFDESPLLQSRHLLLSGEPDGELLAWFTVERRAGILHVLDFWAHDMEGGIRPAHVDVLLRMARKEGCAAISVEMATSPARLAAWASRGFVERGRRPVFRSWSSAEANADAAGFHLTAGDEDE